jgi:hypothetical protein
MTFFLGTTDMFFCLPKHIFVCINFRLGLFHCVLHLCNNYILCTIITSYHAATVYFSSHISASQQDLHTLWLKLPLLVRPCRAMPSSMYMLKLAHHCTVCHAPGNNSLLTSPAHAAHVESPMPDL